MTHNPDTRPDAPTPVASKPPTRHHQDQRIENGGVPTTEGAGQAFAGEVPGSENGRAGRFPSFTGSRRVALAVIAVLALLAIAGFAGAYFLYSRNYVSTDNAQVEVIPVRIAFLDTRGLELIPGMNVTVHIHKN